MHVKVNITKQREGRGHPLSKDICETYVLKTDDIVLKTMPHYRHGYKETHYYIGSEQVFGGKNESLKWMEIHKEEYDRIRLLMNKINLLETEEINKKSEQIQFENGKRFSDIKVLDKKEVKLLTGINVE